MWKWLVQAMQWRTRTHLFGDLNLQRRRCWVTARAPGRLHHGSISALRIRGDKHRRIQPDPQTPGQKLGGQHTNDKKTPRPEQLLLCETAGVLSSQEQNTPKCYSSLPQKYDVGGESNVTLDGLASESSALVLTGSTG